MIRFIDLGKQIGLDEDWPREFSFYNTITDLFISFNGTEVWKCRRDLDEDMDFEYGFRKNEDLRDRLFSLLPDWVPEFYE
jgi:hypothetical protein